MGYYSGETTNYKKLGGVWMHKDCKSKPGAKVKEFVQFGSTYLICMGGMPSVSRIGNTRRDKEKLNE